MITEKLLREFLEAVVVPPLEVFSLRVLNRKNHSLIEINLDNLEHPLGAVSIELCAEVSRRLQEVLDSQLPDENYTLQVASAGAEREIQIPKELVRFQSRPIKLRYLDVEGNEKVEILICTNLEEERAEFQKYNTKGVKKFWIPLKDIRKGNLYLDF